MRSAQHVRRTTGPSASQATVRVCQDRGLAWQRRGGGRALRCMPRGADAAGRVFRERPQSQSSRTSVRHGSCILCCAAGSCSLSPATRHIPARIRRMLGNGKIAPLNTYDSVVCCTSVSRQNWMRSLTLGGVCVTMYKSLRRPRVHVVRVPRHKQSKAKEAKGPATVKQREKRYWNKKKKEEKP
ncbi:hypothetical protein B0T10DRAFT_472181 [Thelonectria olida]|uniref:Uncharacterized protein n=1 Tax=Thelonectria olida TaxID=1576542 RepID=A0A9P8WF47_9HYPO|nr:hypothetical protein B0T10DRAFT_472181 [Thelonectria olida]